MTSTLSFRDIAEILKAIDDSSADEINIEVEGLRLSVSKRGTPTPHTQPIPEVVAESELPKAKQSDSHSAAAETDNPPPAEPLAPSGHEIVRAPMVGTFYRKPSPDELPFVEVGSTVSKGDAVCLIEVMKLYTTIESTTDGEVVSILAEDGCLVEFDQPLFLIKQ